MHILEIFIDAMVNFQNCALWPKDKGGVCRKGVGVGPWPIIHIFFIFEVTSVFLNPSVLLMKKKVSTFFRYFRKLLINELLHLLHTSFEK